MSDDIRIQFDGEPIFRSGEGISGVIVIDDHDGSRIDEVVMRVGWLASGEGYEYEGHHGSLVVREGPLTGSGEHRLPFQFRAPLEPLSYRGHLLRVGHLIEARARIAGGSDLVAEREFELGPGSVVAPPPEPGPEGRLPASRRKAAGVQGALGMGLVMAGFFTFPMPGLILLPIGLLFLSSGMRRAFARGRIGEVIVLVHPRVVSPGEEVRVALALGPPRNVKIDGVTAILRATEVVSRGSSSNRKTQRHEVYSHPVQLAGPRRLEKGAEVLFEALLPIPDQDIWSFKTANGSVEWEVVVEVALASWPDWVSSSPLVVRPGAQPSLAAPVDPRKAVVSETPRSAPMAERAALPARGARPVRRARPVPAAAPVPVGDPEMGGAVSPFEAAVATAMASGIVSGDRRALAAQLVGHAAACSLVIERVERPFSRRLPAPWTKGRIVRGHLSGTGHEVEVIVPEGQADEVDRLRRGDTLEVDGVVAEWARLPDRPVIRQRSREAESAVSPDGR